MLRLGLARPRVGVRVGGRGSISLEKLDFTAEMDLDPVASLIILGLRVGLELGMVRITGKAWVGVVVRVRVRVRVRVGVRVRVRVRIRVKVRVRMRVRVRVRVRMN